MAGVSVMLAMPVHRDIPPDTVMSVVETVEELKNQGIPFTFHMQAGGSLVHHARALLVHAFLKEKYNRLFWLDSDIKWRPADFVRLLALSTQMEIVCGAYPVKQDPPLFMLGLMNRVVESNKFGCIPVKGVGLGFTVMQRKILEQLSIAAPKLKYPEYNEPVARVFRCDQEMYDPSHELSAQGFEGEVRGEDMAFFADIRKLGYTINLDPSITLGHIGSKTYSGSIGYFLTKMDETEEAA